MILSRLFGRKPAPVADGPRRMASVPDGIRVYAVGDVHGCADLLADLLDQIGRDNAARPPAEVHLVMLGDLIDRGPDSRGVVEMLLSAPPWANAMHILRGNHEESFLAVADGNRESMAGWLRFGGLETLQSYGIPPRVAVLAGPMLDAELAANLPRGHIELLRSMNESVQIGDYLFVHAGIRPGVPIDRQDVRDLYWIREEFLASDADHGVTVVHGHTISEDVEERPNRIGIDTGAYRTGRLTAIALEGVDRWFLATGEASEAAGD